MGSPNHPKRRLRALTLTITLLFSIYHAQSPNHETYQNKDKNHQKVRVVSKTKPKTTNSLKQTKKKYTPIMLAALLRHGARTTWIDDHRNFTEQIGVGNLTGNGQRMMFLLGQQFRKNYPDLFNTKKPPRNFDYLLYSSPEPRCISSANSYLQGVYPPGELVGDNVTTAQTGDGLKYMSPPNMNEISVSFDNKTVPSALPLGFRVFPILAFQEQDYMFLSSINSVCPIAGKIQSDTKHYSQQDSDQFVSETITQINKAGFSSQQIFNKKTWGFGSLCKLYDHARSYYYYYGQHLKGITDDLYMQLQLIYSWNFNFKYDGDDKLPPFYTTKMTQQILEQFGLKVNNTKPELKLLMFSGHDTTVFPYMLLKGLISRKCSKQMYQTYMKNKTLISDCHMAPGFGATIIWELNKGSNENEYFVRALYNGKPFKFCQNSVDEFYCEWDEFQDEANQQLILDDFTEFCGHNIVDGSHAYKWLAILFIALTTLLAVFSLVLLCSIRSSKKQINDVKRDIRESTGALSGLPMKTAGTEEDDIPHPKDAVDNVFDSAGVTERGTGGKNVRGQVGDIDDEGLN